MNDVPEKRISYRDRPQQGLPSYSAPTFKEIKNINEAVLMPFGNIYQVGQWVISPSGAPTALLTAKLLSHKLAGVPLIKTH